MLDRRVHAHITTYPYFKVRAWIILIWTSFLYTGYQVTNHYQLFPPKELPLFEFEKDIPFLVWSVLPYFILIGGMYLPIFLRSPDRFLKSLYAFGVAVTINYTIFLFYPTIYPRPELPELTGLSSALYHWLVDIDSPANCFPSGHVCVPAIGIWYMTREFPAYRSILWSAFALLVLSVLTTKQHYVLDIFAGLLSAATGIFAASWLFQMRMGSTNGAE